MKSLFTLLVLAFVAMAPVAQARDLYVPEQYSTIQAAIDDATTGDVILVAGGTYDDVTNQCSPTDTTKCVVNMKSGITLRGNGPETTIVDALGLGRAIYCEGVTNAVIENMTLRGGFAENYGAGIYCYNGSSPVLRRLVIRDNLDGGLITIQNSSPQVTQCRILDNLSKQGGGIAVEDGCSPTFNGVVIAGNEAPSGAGVFIRNNCTVSFTGCIISENLLNSPNASGGGISVVNANLTLTDCLIRNNQGTGPGGGLAVLDFSNLLAENCLIQGNSTEDDNGKGGGVYGEFAYMTLTDCIIADNITVGNVAEGAGIYGSFVQQMDLIQCTVAGNTADDGIVGGGIALFWSACNIDKCIIAGNSGKGLHCVEESNPVVACTDIFGNPGGDDICGTDAGDNFSLDPLFCDAGSGDYRLQDTSPCAPGQHPNGSGACDGERLGGGEVSCTPAGLDEDLVDVRRVLWAQPNPGLAGSTIHFALSEQGMVRLALYDVSGREVRSLGEGTMGAGEHRVVWDGRDNQGERAPAGVYFSKLAVGQNVVTQRVVIVR